RVPAAGVAFAADCVRRSVTWRREKTAVCNSSPQLGFRECHVRCHAANLVIEIATPGVSRAAGRFADGADGNQGIGGSKEIDDARMGTMPLGDHAWPPASPLFSPYFSRTLALYP